MGLNNIYRESKVQLFDTLLEHNPCACFVCEKQTDGITQHQRYLVVAMNKAFREMFAELQYLSLDFDARQLFSSLFSKSFDDFLLDDGQILNHGVNEFVVTTLRMPNDVFLFSLNHHNPQNAPAVLLPVVAINQSDTVFGSFVENTDNVYWVVEGENIRFINSAFARMWCRSVSDAHNKVCNLKQWIHADDRAMAFSWLGKNDWTYQEEYFRIVLPGDAVKWIWNKVHYEKQNNRVIAISTDVTRQKQIEEELIVARNKAQESDKLKTAFLANISHEIRTPMNGIIGFSNLLADDEYSTSEERKSYANIIINSGEQLLNIIDDIIDVAKIESDQLRISPAKVAVNTILDQMLTLFEVEKKRKGASNVVLELHKGLLDSQSLIVTDDLRLRQVLINLLSNALKFTKEGVIRFGYDIAFENSMPYLQFFVSDSGVGIPMDKQRMIFNHFYQIELQEKHSHQSGTGLGLAICNGLVRLLGGRIWVESEVGSGACFSFNIPYQTPNENNQNDGPSVPISNINLTGKTFLVVEDDSVNFDVLSRMLVNTKVKIEHAPSGSDALKKMQMNTFDLVLLDIRLPDINGYDICKHIRTTDLNLPVIAQTAYAFPEDRQKCFDIGFSDYLAKPISRSSLFVAITKQLEN